MRARTIIGALSITMAGALFAFALRGWGFIPLMLGSGALLWFLSSESLRPPQSQRRGCVTVLEAIGLVLIFLGADCGSFFLGSAERLSDFRHKRLALAGPPTRLNQLLISVPVLAQGHRLDLRAMCHDDERFKRISELPAGTIIDVWDDKFGLAVHINHAQETLIQWRDPGEVQRAPAVAMCGLLAFFGAVLVAGALLVALMKRSGA